MTALRFGIRALDGLFHKSNGSDDSLAASKNWTVAIMGPDGCGKSLLALHLAAEYWKNHSKPRQRPCIIYVSTDFSYEQARHAWSAFGLCNPLSREQVLQDVFQKYANNGEQTENLSKNPFGPYKVGEFPLELDKVSPAVEELHGALNSSRDSVAFIDLQAQTAGDDWSFVNQLIGLLSPNTASQRSGRSEGREPRPLVIVDAVEGMETFVGERDGFGERRSRRSRVAQIVRSAARAMCHLVFVIEPSSDRRLPEQFIADLVIRLRLARDGDYLLRTIEIEKCRGVRHTRGEHEISIRDGRGTTSGIHVNLDDPLILREPESVNVSQDKGERSCLSYIHVIPSLHHWNRAVQQDVVPVPDLDGIHRGIPDFGLRLLDNLIGSDPNPIVPQTDYSGSLTILLGDAGTHKSRLARAFLSRAFWEGRPTGAAVLISTGLMDRDMLAKRLEAHLSKGLTQEEKNLVLCRRLSVRHMTSAGFLEIVEKHIDAAEARLRDELARLSKLTGIEPKNPGGLIRIVIDDWNVIQATHPNISEDPLLIQSLVSLLKRRNVTALVVSTQPGQPILPAASLSPQDLRKLDERHVYTWNVSFFGQRCTAVTADRGNKAAPLNMIFELRPWQHPGTTADRLRQKAELRRQVDMLRFVKRWQGSTEIQQDIADVIRSLDEDAFHEKAKELLVNPTDADRLETSEVSNFIQFQNIKPLEVLSVDPEFALYSGVENDTSRRVPLILRLYGGPHTSEGTESDEPQFQRMLKQTFQQIFPNSPVSSVVSFESFQSYDDYFSFADLLDNTRMEHTLVFQVDEFWTAERTSLADLEDYWKRRQVARDESAAAGGWSSCKDEDVYGMLQPHPKNKGLSNGEINNYAPAIERVYNCLQEIHIRPTDPRQRVGRAGDSQLPNDVLEASTIHKYEPAEAASPTCFPCRCHLFSRDSHPYRDIDRIPFLWDFGLIVARKSLWERCKDETLETMGPGPSLKVRDVWNSLCLPADRIQGTATPPTGWTGTVGWNEFLEACRFIARQNAGVVPFDVDVHTSESPSSLLLEMWASYSLMEGKATSEFGSLMFRDDVVEGEDGPSLSTLAREHEKSLYAACVQFVSACSHLEAVNRRLERREGVQDFVASRQWYSTASSFYSKSRHQDLCLLRLPGYFSTRGDWFLAMAHGSRSYLLGERALDLLSGRKLSLLRLQDGLGLPCRDILPDSHIGELKTAIWRYRTDSGLREKLTYDEVCQLGARNIVDEFEPQSDLQRLRWLWRSRIKQYDRDCFYLRRWISRMFYERATWLSPAVTGNPGKWLSGLAKLNLEKPKEDGTPAMDSNEIQDSFHKFRAHRDILISALRETPNSHRSNE